MLRQCCSTGLVRFRKVFLPQRVKLAVHQRLLLHRRVGPGRLGQGPETFGRFVFAVVDLFVPDDRVPSKGGDDPLFRGPVRYPGQQILPVLVFVRRFERLCGFFERPQCARLNFLVQPRQLVLRHWHVLHQFLRLLPVQVQSLGDRFLAKHAVEHLPLRRQLRNVVQRPFPFGDCYGVTYQQLGDRVPSHHAPGEHALLGQALLDFHPQDCKLFFKFFCKTPVFHGVQVLQLLGRVHRARQGAAVVVIPEAVVDFGQHFRVQLAL